MSDTLQLRDKVALITGGGSGIGLGTAQVLSRQGVRVALVGHTPDKLKEAAATLPGESMWVEADVADAEAMQQATRQVAERWGRLDIVCANAGVNGVWAGLEDLEPEEWDATMNTNLRGTFLTVRAAVPFMKERGGSVIITASVNGTRMFSNTGGTAYAVSKAGQVAFAKMTALELARFNIRVNVICPGWIESEIEDNTEKRNVEELRAKVEFPEGAVPLTQGGPGKAEQVGNVVLFLASDLSSHVSGTELYVDGAQSLLQG